MKESDTNEQQQQKKRKPTDETEIELGNEIFRLLRIALV